MAGTASGDAGAGRTADGISSGQRCQSGEALAEWRSSEQVENGTPSTSPPYWDTDDDDDGGLKPSQLYGKYTWKIEKFSQINKRELRSNVFEVGGYKWYILIYPQGCDVCNHLSLFLCVANHDKLLPGWSHFAQFTIAVVNKDPKKSKYSDTLHRFWKKEHDWGWKKFMELSKVSDGFLDAADTLIIKAQVQVIREKTDRPFRCLDCQYRRELVRVYLTNVEQICRRFVEERRGKLGRLLEDKNRWSSFCAFWLGMDQNSRRRMSREKMDVILKVVVKHFFIEKEVTSTLVMDSLYSGLKALEGQTKNKKGRVKLLDAEEIPAPIVRVEKDTFVLVDDVLLLLERAAMEPLPPKDEKGPQNRTKDGNSGDDFNKDSIERDERRLTELGRRTVEIFVLAHIFNHKIEVAYQEAVALKRQEELIREEEEAWMLVSEQKAKRGATEKEKKSKKKQAKQKRNNRKGKEKGKEAAAALDNHMDENASNEKQVPLINEAQPMDEKPDVPDDVCYVSDSLDGLDETLQPDSEDRDVSPVNWDTDTSEVHPPAEASSSGVSGLSSGANGTSEKRGVSAMDDSSSTCSTDSVPSVVTNGPYKGSSFSSYQCEKSPSRGKNHRGKIACDGSWGSEADSQPSGSATESGDLNATTANGKSDECASVAVARTLQDTTTRAEQHVVKKEKVASPSKKPSTTNIVELEKHSKEKTASIQTSPASPSKSPVPVIRTKPEKKISPTVDTSVQAKNKISSSPSPQPTAEKGPAGTHNKNTSPLLRPETQNAASAPKLPEKSTQQQVPVVVSRPSSAPLVPGPRPATPVVSSMAQTSPSISRSASATGRLGPDPTLTSHSYIPQSYRNAIVGNSAVPTSTSYSHPSSPSSVRNLSTTATQQNSVQSGYPPFAMMTSRDVLHNGHQWIESSQRDSSRGMHYDSSPSSMLNGIQNLDLYNRAHGSSGVSRGDHFPAELPTSTSGRQNQVGVSTDEFPHLDIINDLLDDEHVIGRTAEGFHPFGNNEPHYLFRHSSFPSDLGPSGGGDLCSSTTSSSSSSSSCRFERARSYQDGVFQRGYSSFGGGPYDSIRDYIPQGTTSPLPYSNGQMMDGLISNQWQMSSTDLSFAGMRNSDGDRGSPAYFSPDYSNLACGVNGYAAYRPSNGH
ncbi:unnamed protein product [Linum tenue]|uniref:MATH domain-containing protein n=1 Tax=Linum tenue TaxID=586396 RepID=A0AAV0RNR9_9ROSI|nr:unnamed protein product [Linum tenue]